jgi:RND superfamily putative drug exporter
LLARLAGGCVRHRWIVIGVWVALLVGINIVAGVVGPDYRTDFTLPDSESKQVQDVLEASDPDRAGFTAQIVARSEAGFDDPAVRSTLEQIYEYAASKGDISVTSPYDSPQQISQDGTVAFAQLDIRDSRTFPEMVDVGTRSSTSAINWRRSTVSSSSTEVTCSPSSRCLRARSTA